MHRLIIVNQDTGCVLLICYSQCDRLLATLLIIYRQKWLVISHLLIVSLLVTAHVSHFGNTCPIVINKATSH